MVPFLNMGWLLWFGHFEFSGMMVVESHDNKLIERSPIETCWTRFVWNWWNDGPYDGNIHERIILEILEVPVATSLCDTFSKCNYDNSTLAVLLWNTLGYLFAHVCASLCGQTCRERTWSKWKIDHECTIETATPSWPFCSAGTSLFLCISAFRYQYANPSKHQNIGTSEHHHIRTSSSSSHAFHIGELLTSPESLEDYWTPSFFKARVGRNQLDGHPRSSVRRESDSSRIDDLSTVLSSEYQPGESWRRAGMDGLHNVSLLLLKAEKCLWMQGIEGSMRPVCTVGG